MQRFLPKRWARSFVGAGGAVVFAAFGLAAALVATRVMYSGYDSYRFLYWNLFLAAIPWVLAVGVRAARTRPMIVAALGAWILFLPNAPYLLTDFLHLHQRPLVPLWYDVLLLGAASVAGLISGLFSLRIVHRRIEKRFGARWGWTCALVAVTASGYGIYIGRFERLNSWDVLLNPFHAIPDLIHVGQRPIVVTLVCAALFGLLYLAFAHPTWRQPT